MPKIMISYRRKDSDAITGRIRDRIVERFGEKSIFMDIDNIPLGVDFRKQIQETLRQDQILLAIIGPNWTGPVEGGKARIFDPTDPVRIEVETALARGTPTIPVLVGGAQMPTAAMLPDSLKDFPYFNAAEVSSGLDFHQHVDRLIRAIEQIARQTGTDTHRGPAVPMPRKPWLAAGIGAAVLVAAAILAFVFRAALPGVHAPLERSAAPPTVQTSASAEPPPTSPPPQLQAVQQPPAPPVQAPPAVTAAPPSSDAAQAVPPASAPSTAAAVAPDPAAAAKAAAQACDPGSFPIFYDDFKAVDPTWDGISTDRRNGAYLEGNTPGADAPPPTTITMSCATPRCCATRRCACA